MAGRCRRVNGSNPSPCVGAVATSGGRPGPRRALRWRRSWRGLGYLWLWVLSAWLVACTPPWGASAVPPVEQWPAAAQQPGFEPGLLVQRLHEGNLVVRRADGSRLVLSPRRACTWCWMSVGRRVYLRVGPDLTVVVSDQGDVAECWTRAASGGR